MAAKGAAKEFDKTPVSDWCDIANLEAAWNRQSKGAKEVKLTELKNIINNDKVYKHTQVTPFSSCADRKTKKLHYDVFKTHGWFLLMANGNEADAKKLAQKIADDEGAKQEAAKKAPKKKDDVTSRLTDTSKYTGAHKERFDADGKGKGIDGRETRVKNDGFTGQYKGSGTFGQASGGTSSTADEITKKMTDASLYTGAHKSRFGADGKGKGIDGRENRTENTGYVSGYKNAGSHGKK